MAGLIGMRTGEAYHQQRSRSQVDVLPRCPSRKAAPIVDV